MAPSGPTLRTAYTQGQSLKPFLSPGGVARLSPHGLVLATVCGEDAHLVDPASGAVLATLDGDSEPVTALTWSHDGNAVYTASRSMQCRVWELTRVEQGGPPTAADNKARPSGSSSGVSYAAVSTRAWKAHPLPATGSADRSARVWDTRRGHCTHAFRGHEAPVLATAFHPVPGRLLLFTASEDTTARVWSLSGSACLAVLKCHVSAVTSLGVIPAGLGPHGDALVLGGRDKVVSVWAIPQGASAAGAAMADKPVATVLVYEAVEAVLAFALPPPGSAASAASLAKKAGRGDAAGGAKGSSTSLEGVMFMTAGDKGIVRTWSAAGGGKCVASAPADAVCSGPEAGFMALALVPRARPAPPGHHQVMATTTDGRVMFYSPSSEAGRTSSAASVDTWRLSWQLLGNLDEVIDVRCISAAGSSAAATTPAPPACIVAVTNSAVVRVLDGTTLGCVASLEGHSDTVLCADVAAWPTNTGDAHTGVTACIVTGGKDRCLRLWRLVGPSSSGATAAAWEVACLGAGEGHAGAVTAIACGTRTAGLVVTGGADKLLKLWDCSPSLATSSPGEAAVPFRVRGAVVAHDKEVNAVAVAPNEQLVATASADRTLKLWRLPTLVPHRTLRGHTRGVWSCAFSPVDAVLVSGSADKSVRVWSCTDGACLKALQGHASGVLRALWLTHGAQVASAGVDGCLKLWNVAAGECVWTGEGHDSKAWALAACSDGTSLVSGGADGTLALWADATSADAEAKAAATEAAALADQQLATAMAGNAFAPAFRLALQLARPGALYTLLSRHFSGLSARDESRSAALIAALQATPVEGLARFLAVCTEWNANSKTCHVAQTSLACLFTALPPGDVAKLPGARDLLPGFAAYTKRHSARLDRLVRATYVLDFTLTQQGVLLEEDEDGEGDDVAAAAAAAGADAWEGDAAAWGVPVPVPRAGLRGEASRAPVPRHMGGDDDDFTINVGGAEADDEDELPGWGGGGDDGVEEEDPQPEEPPPRASSRATRGGAADDTAQDVDAGAARRSTRAKRAEPEANDTSKKGAKRRKG